MIVAYIANLQLQQATDAASARAFKSVRALLATDSDTLTAPDIAGRATWADKYRDSDRYGTKARYNATHNWHFVDIELSDGDIRRACPQDVRVAPHQASAGPAEDCVVNKIEQFVAELRDPTTPKSEKQIALKFLLHLVGDLHQPLHAADNNDRGGNSVPVVYGNLHRADNLHAYWDKKLVLMLGKDPADTASALNKGIRKSDALEWSKGTPTEWAQDSYKLAKTVAYDLRGEKYVHDDHGGQAFRLGEEYDSRALPVVREQLIKAGVRLAETLRRAFAPMP